MGILQSIERRAVGFAKRIASRWGGVFIDRRAAPKPPRGRPARPGGEVDPDKPPIHADERTIRQVGEAQLGGMSTEESRAAYERGENPGGLHHGGKGPAPPPRGNGD
jgi:hypothetical protein